MGSCLVFFVVFLVIILFADHTAGEIHVTNGVQQIVKKMKDSREDQSLSDTDVRMLFANLADIRYSTSYYCRLRYYPLYLVYGDRNENVHMLLDLCHLRGLSTNEFNRDCAIGCTFWAHITQTGYLLNEKILQLVAYIVGSLSILFLMTIILFLWNLLVVIGIIEPYETPDRPSESHPSLSENRFGTLLKYSLLGSVLILPLVQTFYIERNVHIVNHVENNFVVDAHQQNEGDLHMKQLTEAIYKLCELTAKAPSQPLSSGPNSYRLAVGNNCDALICAIEHRSSCPPTFRPLP